MKSLVLLAAVLVLNLTLDCGRETTSSQSGQGNGSARQSEPDLDATPLEIVNRRMSAYNRHDLAGFLDLYADDVAISTYPDKSLGSGREHLGSIFEPMFAEGIVEVTVHHQIAKDSFVVNHETVTDGSGSTEYVSIYEVEDGLIQSVGFVRD